MRPVVALAFVVALAACSPKAGKDAEAPPAPDATAATTVKPGQWRTTVTMLDMSAPGVPAAALAQMKSQPPSVTTDCTTSDDIREFTGKRAARDGQCTMSRMDAGGGRIDGESTCTVEGMTQTVKMSGTYGAERVEMDIDINAQTPAGAMSQKMHMVSERVGDCPA
jgi:hypothetical protein